MKLKWNFGIRKNSAVIAVITLLLAVAVYLNWSYSRNPEADGMNAALAAVPTETAADADLPSDAQRFSDNAWVMASESGETVGVVTQLSEYFSNARLSRQQSKDDNASADAKTNAEAAIAAMATNAVSESRIESLVIAKGFPDCVAIIDGKTVSVVVSTPEEGLIGSDVAKIKDIVIAETQIGADQIRIIEANA